MNESRASTPNAKCVQFVFLFRCAQIVLIEMRSSSLWFSKNYISKYTFETLRFDGASTDFVSSRRPLYVIFLNHRHFKAQQFDQSTHSNYVFGMRLPKNTRNLFQTRTHRISSLIHAIFPFVYFIVFFIFRKIKQKITNT